MIRFSVLGPLSVSRDGSTVHLNAQMLRRLLAALLVRSNRPVSLHDLIAALWGESAPPGARKTVQIYVHRLRQALSSDAQILQEPAGYRLMATSEQLDAELFGALVERGQRLSDEGELREAAQVLGQALDLWRGCAYEDLSDLPPVWDEARRLDEERLRVTSEHIEIRLKLGDHENVIPKLVGLTESHPYREDLCGQLMLALYRSGRRGEALEVYQRARRLLDQELGLEPGQALRQLHQAILRGAPELEFAHEDMTPTLAVPRELPAPPHAFTGRRPQIEALDRILSRHPPDAVSIALVTGSGGVGKTALALYWAHSVAGKFPDGQLYLDLRGYATGASVRPIEALTALLRT